MISTTNERLAACPHSSLRRRGQRAVIFFSLLLGAAHSFGADKGGEGERAHECRCSARLKSRLSEVSAIGKWHT
eukprot:scaffold5174_cov118-Isochrysis_galbana.AAC.11